MNESMIEIWSYYLKLKNKTGKNKIMLKKRMKIVIYLNDRRIYDEIIILQNLLDKFQKIFEV